MNDWLPKIERWILSPLVFVAAYLAAVVGAGALLLLLRAPPELLTFFVIPILFSVTRFTERIYIWLTGILAVETLYVDWYLGSNWAANVRLVLAMVPTILFLSEIIYQAFRLRQRAEAALRQQAARLQTAVEVGRAATSTLELDTLLNTSVELIRQHFGLYHAAVFLIESGGEAAVLRAASGEAVREFRTSGFQLPLAAKSLVGTAAATRQPQVCQDVLSYSDHSLLPSLPATRAEVALPLMAGGAVLGLLDLHSTEPNSFTNDILAVLTIFADQIAVAIQNAQLHAAEKERARELENAYHLLRDNQAKLLITEKMASLGRLTSGIAHEINTPIAAVRAALAELTQLIEEYRQAVDSDSAQVSAEDHHAIAQDMERAVQAAASAAERTANFVRSIKSQTLGLATHERERFNAVPVIQEALLLLSHHLRKANCAITLNHTSDYVEMYGPPGQLIQVVTQLVMNAIDASRERGGGPITLRLVSDRDSVDLQVEDVGSGMPPQDIPKIFDPMYTTKPFGEGVGLGLTVVHDIVTGEFGGTIEVASEVGRGTTFTLHFPLPTAQEVDHAA